MNEAAKKIVAREARAEARLDGAPGAIYHETMATNSFDTFRQSYPEVAAFRGAEAYFARVFARQFDDARERGIV